MSNFEDAGKGLSAEDAARLNKALDDLMDEVSDNHLSFVGPERQRLRLFHQTYKSLGKSMRQPRNCMYPGCAAKSVPRSHTIQKAGPLRFIAEDSHVVSPAFSLAQKGYEIKRIGLNNASTFPGFCLEHEGLFHEYENSKELVTKRDVPLQVFRTICREIAVKKIQKSEVRNLLEDHDRLVAANGLKILKQRLGNEFVQKYGLKSLAFDGVSKGQVAMRDSERELKDVLMGLETDFLPAATMEINGTRDMLFHFVVSVQHSLPVCLSGIGNFWINDNGKQISVRTVLNVLPSPQMTLIVATTLIMHKKYLENYMHHMLAKILGPMSMIEAWMVRGTDHWFMTPSQWDAIPASRQSKILEDMWDESLSIGDAYPLSILDSVREHHLELPETKAKPKKIYDIEAAKLSDRKLI